VAKEYSLDMGAPNKSLSTVSGLEIKGKLNQTVYD